MNFLVIMVVFCAHAVILFYYVFACMIFSSFKSFFWEIGDCEYVCGCVHVHSSVLWPFPASIGFTNTNTAPTQDYSPRLVSSHGHTPRLPVHEGLQRRPIQGTVSDQDEEGDADDDQASSSIGFLPCVNDETSIFRYFMKM